VFVIPRGRWSMRSVHTCQPKAKSEQRAESFAVGGLKRITREPGRGILGLMALATTFVDGLRSCGFQTRTNGRSRFGRFQRVKVQAIN
jgi:hypothetical protein